jgi:hypothetical protein
MIPTGRLYGDYHAGVWQLVIDVLRYHDIDFDVILPLDRIDSDSTDLLIVWSDDCLSSRETTAAPAQRACQEFIDQLSASKRPVIWLTAVHHAYLDFEHVGQNVRFLHYGGDMMFGMKQYPLTAPQRQKTFDPIDQSQWISLNLSVRAHRVLSACCLLGHGLGDLTDPKNRGLLRIDQSAICAYESLEQFVRDSVQGTIQWSHSQDRVLQAGFLKLKAICHGGQPAGRIYDRLNGWDNATNFDRSLRSIYQNSMIEIVNETTFFSNGIFVTEKFLNSVYGFNLPLILSNPGTVAYLRSHGFNMFDDVLNHAYDDIDDPVDRIFAAIHNNRKLLTDFDYAKQCYQTCLPGLEQNYKYATQDMYDHFRAQFIQNFQSCLVALCIDLSLR